MLLFKYLHIVTMFSAVGIAVGSELLLHRVAASGDLVAVRVAFRMAKPLQAAIPLLFLLGLAFGLVAAVTGAFDLLAPWLLIAYAIFVVAMAIGAIVQSPWVNRVAEAASASPSTSGGEPSPELTRLLHDPLPRYAMYASWLLIIAIVFVMVVKPFA